ncbi:MAG: hypothetical protein WCO65_00020 [bacterium]
MYKILSNKKNKSNLIQIKQISVLFVLIFATMFSFVYNTKITFAITAAPLTLSGSLPILSSSYAGHENYATAITSTSAHITGHIDGYGVGSGVSSYVSTWGFRYGTTSSYGSTISTTQNSSVSATVGSNFSTDLTGLYPCTTYYYQAYASGSTGTYYGYGSTVTTNCTPVVSTGSTTNFTLTSAVLNGNLGTLGGGASSQGMSGGFTYYWLSPATVGFQYGTTLAYGLTSTTSSMSSTGVFTENISGLTPCTTYYYRAFTTNGATVFGSGSSFTSGCITTTSASSIHSTSVTLNGTLTSSSDVVGFQYGTTSSYGATSTTYTASTGSISRDITGLTPCTTYHYRAFSPGGVYAATESTFTTICLPAVTTTGSSLITSSSAKLAGAISYVGSYSPTISNVGFQYGTTTAYGATSTVSGTFGTGPFTDVVTGLACATTYHYRAYATNLDSGYGSDMTFTTTPCAGSSGNVTGQLWNSTTGWISLNCIDGGVSGANICSSSPYSVNVTPNLSTRTGLFSGKAWSSSLGWVSFNGGDVTSCGIGGASSTSPGATGKLLFPTGTSTTGQVSGWAKVLSTGSSWDGCISLRGTGYGVTYVSTATSNNLAGLSTNPSYGWGGSTVGWVSAALANVNLGTSTVALSLSNSTLTSAGGTVSISWTTSNVLSTACTASSTSGGGWSGSKSSSGGSDLLTFAPNTTTSTITKTYTLGCTGMFGNSITSVPVSITIAPGSTSTTSSLTFLANNSGSATSTPITISSGSLVILTWQMQNMTHGTCRGTSSGSFSGWNNTYKSPLSTDASVGNTPVTFSEIIPPGVITTNRTYTMTCTGGADGVTRTKTVYINVGATSATPSVALTANGTSGTLAMPSSGGNLTLDWTTANLDAASCTASSADGRFTGPVSSSGGTYVVGVISPNTSTSTTITQTYTIGGCTSNGAVVTPVTVTVTVAPVGYPFVAFYASDGINSGNNISVSPTATTTLSWVVQNISANSCKGTSNGNYTGWLTAGSTKLPSTTITSSSTTYSESIGLVSTYRSYTLTCTGTNGATIFRTVTLNGSTTNLVNLSVNDGIDIVPNQTNITLPSSGGTANIVWSTTNLSSTSCTASSSAGDWTGSRSSSGGSNALSIPANASAFAITRTYTLSGCIDTTGATVPAETVSVTVSPAGVPFLSFFANGFGNIISIVSGGTVNLGWRLQNIAANICRGTSSGSFTNWNNTNKGPSSSVGTTATTTHETVGLDGSITSTRTYTMTCGTLPSQSITVNIATPCTGSLCTSTSTGIKATNRPSWMEI